MRTRGNGKYQSMDNTKIGIKRGLLPEKLRGLQMNGTKKEYIET